MNFRHLLILAGTLSLGGLLPGCVVYDRDADVTFLWDRTTCGPGESVNVYLEELDDDDFETAEAEVACADGGVTFEDLDPGDYYLEIVVFPSGARTYDEIALRGGDNEFEVSLP